MSSLMRLRELDIHEEEDQPLLERFEECRHSVIRVSSSPTMHECIAVTTKGGFVELINVVTGAFRVFLSHLGNMPLDSALRCFSLVPALYAARGGHHLLYSLAHSNELLLADMERGTVVVLGVFHSRPSVVFCDGDHMGCGEGCGQVTLWRAPGAADEAMLLWRRSVFDDTVVCITMQRNYVVCSSADYRCYVLSLASGDVVAALPQDSAPAVALQSVIGLQQRSSFMLLCLPSVLFVFSPASNECASAVATDSAWPCAAVLRLDVSISCASCCDGFMAFGTASGVVLLMGMDEASGGFVERVRFDVGFSVVGIQLFTNGALVVITSVGDVWKWAVADLLPSEDEKDEGEGEGVDDEDEKNGMPLPNAQSPRATLPPPPPLAAAAAAAAGGAAVSCPPRGENVKEQGSEYYGDEGEEIVVVIDDDVIPPSCCCSSSSRLSAQAVEVWDSSASASDADGGGISCCAVDDAGVVRELTVPPECSDVTSVGLNSRNASAFPASGAAAPPHVVGDDICSELSLPPSSISILGCTTGVADTVQSACFAPPQPAPNLQAPPPQSNPYSPRLASATTTVTRCDERRPQRGDVTLAVRDPGVRGNTALSLSPRALQRVLRGADMGPPAVISGLRAGTRMDPRKARQIVENARPAASPPDIPESQSSRMLVDHRQVLEAATFDHNAYAKAHPLKVEALKHRHSVKLPAYGMHTQVFATAVGAGMMTAAAAAAAANSHVQDHLNTVSGEFGGGGKFKQQQQQQQQQQQHAPSTMDDLMDITFQKFARRKDVALEEERRLRGPDIRRHLCSSLLCGSAAPSGAVLFHELRVHPGAPATLLLPMPLPSTPSVL